MSYEYYKLLDSENKDTIVRTQDRKQEKWDNQRGWIETGVLIRYFNDESEYYELYEKMSEKEADRIIISKRAEYERSGIRFRSRGKSAQGAN